MGAGYCCGRAAVSGFINTRNSRKSIPAPASSSPLERAGVKPINLCVCVVVKRDLESLCWIWKGLGSLCPQQRRILLNLGQHGSLPSGPSSRQAEGEAKPPNNKSWGNEPAEGRNSRNLITHPQWSVAQITFFKV